MTAESLPSYESTENVAKLRIVKAGEEVTRSVVVPPVLEWGPAHLREDAPILEQSAPAYFED